MIGRHSRPGCVSHSQLKRKSQLLESENQTVAGDQFSIELKHIMLCTVYLLHSPVSLFRKFMRSEFVRSILPDERNPCNLIGRRLCHHLHLLCHISISRFLSNSSSRHRFCNGIAESEGTTRQQRLSLTLHLHFTSRIQVHRATKVPPKDDAPAVGRRKDGGGSIAGSPTFPHLP